MKKKLWPWNGKEYTIDELCKIGEISKAQFYRRIKKGWSIDQIVNNKPVHHGMYKTRLYKTYQAMIDRCYNHNSKPYKGYGARGIDVCDEWRNDNTTFFDWALSHGYNDKLTIDRIDNDKGYYPDNCRWVDYSTQLYNRRNTVLLWYNNKWRTIREIAQIENISRGTVYYRYIKGKKTKLPRK